MGRKKGYQRASSEMSQTSDYHFGSSSNGNNSSTATTTTGGALPFLFKSFASSFHTGGGGGGNTSHISGPHHMDQFDNSNLVIGASHSILDNAKNSSILDLDNNNASSSSARHSESSSIGSFYSTNNHHVLSSNSNIGGGGGSGSKRAVNKKFVKNLQQDADDDWDDSIDTEIKYPNIEDLKLSTTNTGNASALPPLTNTLGTTTTATATTAATAGGNALVSNYKQIIDDSFVILQKLDRKVEKYRKFIDILDKDSIDLQKLKKLAWNGIPVEIRPIVWQLLLGYLPTNKTRRKATLTRKRQEYLENVKRAFGEEEGGSSLSKKDQIIWHQIEIDVPRTNPHIKLYQFESTQKSLERILYLWAIRHPASGYVQGINDLCTPIYQVFLSLYLSQPEKVTSFNTNNLDQSLVDVIEADTFWCLTKILDTIQDNYIHEQPGIIRQVNELTNLIKRIDVSLIDHFEEQGLNFLQFSFRWMNCLLMRELNISLIIRMWDTYISEFPNGFNEFHVYVCAAFLMKFSDDLKEMEFQDIILYLQDLTKTKNWKLSDVELMMSEAFIWQSLYKNATAHLK